MGIFPRISKESITAVMDEMSASTEVAIHSFLNEQPIVAAAMIAACKSNEEFCTRMSAMAFIYWALEKQTKTS